MAIENGPVEIVFVFPRIAWRLSRVSYAGSPEGSSPFSHGFPIVFPSFPMVFLFSNGFSYDFPYVHIDSDTFCTPRTAPEPQVAPAFYSN